MNDDFLVWLDLEMTGLDPQRDTILEIATIITDAQLEIRAESRAIAIAHTPEQLAAMNPWCIEHHEQSGLTARCAASTITTAAAEAEILAFLRQWLPAGKSPLCGNSIGQDRRFLVRWMPELEAFFHYRNLDVSTIKELVARWYPERAFHKESRHLALEDIRDSIAELRHYRTHVFQPV